MTQIFSPLATQYRTSRTSEVRDRIGFWLSVLLLCLLPLERLILPLAFRMADFALVLLTLHGLGRAWRTRQRLEFPLLLPMWLILLSSLVATLVALAHPDSIIAIVQEVYLFAWFIVLTNVLKTFPPSDMDRLMKVWAVIACAEAVTTVMGMFRIGPAMFYTRPYRDLTATADVVRAIGTYVNSNAVGVYLSVSFFVLLATSWPVWLRFLLGVWLYAGMFGTGSNGALFSTLGGLLILVVANAIIKSRRETMIMLWGAIIAMGAGLVGVVLFMLSLSPSLLSGFDTGGLLFLTTLRRFSHSLATRLDLIGFALRVYMRHPLGTGPNSFSTILASLHSDYAAFLFERGPVGFIGWLWMLGATLLMPWRAANQLIDSHQRWQVLALGAGFFACALNAFAHEVSHMRQVWALMVFLFALSCAHLTQRAGSSPGGKGTDGGKR